MSALASSIEQAPRHVPNWHLMMADLCQPAPEDLARLLGLSKRSIQRFNAADHAPRAVELAVYWLTTWGRSQIDCQAVNAARLAIGYADSLERQVKHLQAIVVQLTGLGQHGAANDPTPTLSPERKEDVRISAHRGRSFQPIVDGISDERGRCFRLIVDDVSA